MFGDVATEIGDAGKIHRIGYLGNGKLRVVEIVFNDRDGVTVDKTHRALSGLSLDGIRKILGRNVHHGGIVPYLPVPATLPAFQKSDKLVDHAGSALCGNHRFAAPCMKSEKVVHHGKRQTAQQFLTERVRRVGQPLFDAPHIGQEQGSLVIAYGNDRVFVQTDRAANAEIVGRQLVVQKLQRAYNDFHLQIMALPDILDQLRLRDDDNIVLAHDESPSVIGERGFAGKAQDVDAPAVIGWQRDVVEPCGTNYFRVALHLHRYKDTTFGGKWIKYLRKM